MPQQEQHFEHMARDRRIEVIKTYDRSYAREAFNAMDDAARANLWSALEIDLNYQPEDIPAQDAPGAEAGKEAMESTQEFTARALKLRHEAIQISQRMCGDNAELNRWMAAAKQKGMTWVGDWPLPSRT